MQTPMKLGAICQEWRQIAWSASRLWTDICPKTGPHEDVATYAGRHWRVLRKVAPYYPRHLYTVPRIFVCKHKTRCNSPWLVRGQLFNSPPSIPVFRHIFVKPRHLELYRFSARCLYVDLNAITSMMGIEWHDDDPLDFLETTPNAESFYLTRTSFPAHSECEIYTHHKLVDLSITFPSNENNFFREIALPNLRSFSLKRDWHIKPDNSELIAFFQRSRCPVTYLCIQQLEFSKRSLDILLQAVPTLTHLELGLGETFSGANPARYPRTYHLLSYLAQTRSWPKKLQRRERYSILPLSRFLDVRDIWSNCLHFFPMELSQEPLNIFSGSWLR